MKYLIAHYKTFISVLSSWTNWNYQLQFSMCNKEWN